MACLLLKLVEANATARRRCAAAWRRPQEWREAAATVIKLPGPGPGPEQRTSLDLLRARVAELEQTTAQARADLADSHDDLAQALGLGDDAEWADLISLAADASQLRARVAELETTLKAKGQDADAVAERNCLAFAVQFAFQWCPDAPSSLRPGLEEILATMPEQAGKDTGRLEADVAELEARTSTLTRTAKGSSPAPPGRTHTNGNGYQAPELINLFRVQHVTPTPSATTSARWAGSAPASPTSTPSHRASPATHPARRSSSNRRRQRAPAHMVMP